MLPTGVASGQIYRHPNFYRDRTGAWQTKYLLVLAGTLGGDVVFRLLTSRRSGRPENPPCYHGDPYPGFYLGVLGAPLTAPTWLDLRKQDDYDGEDFRSRRERGDISFVFEVHRNTLCNVLSCAAAAEDTTRQQSTLMLDQRAALKCL